MWTRFFIAPVAAATVLAASPDLLVPQLESKTLAAFDRYVTATETRIATEVDGSKPFLWVNRLDAAAKADAMARLNRGEVVSAPLETWANGKKITADEGLIHHWIGTVLLPKVSLTQARALVEKYEQYPRVLGPMVQRAKVIEHTGNDFVVQMRTTMKKVITVVIDADYRVTYRPVGASRLYTKSVATNLFEVSDAGEPGESRTPGDKSGGFLWRLNTYCSFEAIQEGTLEQCESVSLTRGVPWWAYFAKPFVTSIPRETLAFTLGRVRDEAVKSLKTAETR